MKKIVVLLTSLCMCFIGFAQAQFDSVFTVMQDFSFPTSVVQVGDIDNDGDIDVIGRQDNEVHYFLNNGKGKFGQEMMLNSGYCSFINPGYYAEFGDLDHNGKNDIVCYSDKAKKVIIYIDNLSSMFEMTNSSFTDDLGDLKLGDINKDGYTDIVLLFQYGNILWLENTKTDISKWIIHEIPNTDFVDEGDLIDFNKDGNLDILKTSDNGFGHDILINDGTGNFTLNTIDENNRFQTVVGITANDFDKDGDMDIIGGIDDYDGYLITYKNQGTTYKKDTIADSKYEFYDLVFYDFDSDGDMDIIGGCWMGCNFLMYRNDNGTFHKTNLEYGGSIEKKTLKIADINGDKKMDLVFTNAGNNSIRWLRNSYTCSSFSVINKDFTGNYTSPSKKYIWTKPGTYKDTIKNYKGCDSIITVNLVVPCKATNSTLNISQCSTYTSPSGKHIWKISGTYSDTIRNKAGCDSIITINLKINSYAKDLYINTCTSYKTPGGNITYTKSGTYTESYKRYNGCDSIITIHLSISDKITISKHDTACSPYISPSGRYTWTVSGTYKDTIFSSGCDTIIYVYLTIRKINTFVSYVHPSLVANKSGAVYQWLDCSNNYQPIEGETNRTFTPSANGSYAVKITSDNCSYISACYAVKNVGLTDNSIVNLNVFPNPSNGEFYIKSDVNTNNIKICVFDILGKAVPHEVKREPDKITVTISGETGIYLLHLRNYKEISVLKLVKQ